MISSHMGKEYHRIIIIRNSLDTTQLLMYPCYHAFQEKNHKRKKKFKEAVFAGETTKLRMQQFLFICIRFPLELVIN